MTQPEDMPREVGSQEATCPVCGDTSRDLDVREDGSVTMSGHDHPELHEDDVPAETADASLPRELGTPVGGFQAAQVGDRTVLINGEPA